MTLKHQHHSSNTFLKVPLHDSTNIWKVHVEKVSFVKIASTGLLHIGKTILEKKSFYILSRFCNFGILFRATLVL